MAGETPYYRPRPPGQGYDFNVTPWTTTLYSNSEFELPARKISMAVRCLSQDNVSPLSQVWLVEPNLEVQTLEALKITRLGVVKIRRKSQKFDG
ncbi:hypothetical protein DHEL01_v211936 [Diaporthe helianthi]|uniref:Uncharacterized protein n=1 Tax=Diaporthe helianthi TaxID=158607 RepID=A0A2P5HHE0_DIAHE|nr:hypothetical protein DHEL01_v211936 [Diaporthe helianthi]